MEAVRPGPREVQQRLTPQRGCSGCTSGSPHQVFRALCQTLSEVAIHVQLSEPRVEFLLAHRAALQGGCPLHRQLLP